ncbi:MAG: sigma-70 family RNA polymerase sigma factor [Planctomycetes bacterium]|nr:sigma-70 family RNA polymerase sigma factor [Planctomycetota bacterium]
MTDLPEITGSDRQSSSGTSRSLLERARADDAAAWDRLVGLYAPLVLHWCRCRGLQEPDVADVFQEVFLAVATHIGGFRKRQPGDTFRGWLRTITSNKVLDHFRRRQRHPGGVGGSEALDRLTLLPAPLSIDEGSIAEVQAERGLFHRALELVRGEFEPHTWQAFWKTAVEGRMANDVAADLGMSAGAVRVAKSRVLHRLREELRDLLE